MNRAELIKLKEIDNSKERQLRTKSRVAWKIVIYSIMYMALCPIMLTLLFAAFSCVAVEPIRKADLLLLTAVVLMNGFIGAVSIWVSFTEIYKKLGSKLWLLPLILGFTADFIIIALL